MRNQSKLVDVSINLTAHREGILFYKTLRSTYADITYAQEHGLNIELNITLDNSDAETKNIADMFVKEHSKIRITVSEVSFGDVSLCRNFLIDASKGKYIAFFDADDFFTENFIYQAFVLAEKNDQPACYSAKYILNFGGIHCLFPVLDTASDEISKQYFFETNYFVSQNFVHRDIYNKIRYSPLTKGYGFEDWHFNCEVIAAGYEFLTVPETMFCYRRKTTNSLLADHLNSNSLMRATKLFEPEVFTRLPRKVQASLNTTNQQPSSLSKNLKDFRFRLQGHILLYHYIKTTYNLNVGTVRALKIRLEENRQLKTRLVTAKVEDDQITGSLPDRLTKIGITSETIKFWAKLNKFEPMIHPSRSLLQHIPIANYPNQSEVSEAYYELSSKYAPKHFTDVILIPHMVRGGAELATLHLVEAMSKLGKRPLIITTADSESPWAYKVREIKGADIVEGRELFKYILDHEMRLLLLMRVIQNWSIDSLTVINSEVGYKLITKYAKVISQLDLKVFIHTYAFDVTEDGYIFNYIQNGLCDTYPAVTKYVTDSEIYRKELIAMNGYDATRAVTAYLPINKKINKKTAYRKTRRVLYAARICNQKIADVAVEVGAILETHGIELHFYGNIDPEYAEDNKFLNLIKTHPNIHYKGLFDGFDAIDLSLYDMFLLTTRTEGMANVILEACKANIYVISAAVGGLSECIVNDANGFLLTREDRFKASAYASAILDAYHKKSYKDIEKIDHANNKVRKRHSKMSYQHTIQGLFS
jgi:glycosyltransferase involved in cell wall biosynthesis